MIKVEFELGTILLYQPSACGGKIYLLVIVAALHNQCRGHGFHSKPGKIS